MNVDATYEFDAEILQSDAVGAGAFILFPYDPLECFGKRNMIKVQCTFDGVPYRGSIANMGEGPCIGVLKSIRERLGKGRGDTVRVTVREDREERVVVVPDDLSAAIGSSRAAKALFDTLSYSNRKLYVDWINSAKTEGTRTKRVGETVAKLEAGIRKLK